MAGTKRPKKKKWGIPPQISGMGGVFHVASELSRLGFIALPTNRNVAGYDIIASSHDGLRTAIIQVKTLQRKEKYWPMGKDVPDYMKKSSRAFYVFARYNKDIAKYECYVVSAKEVAKHIQDEFKKHYETNSEAPSSWIYGWHLPQGREKSYLERWNKLRLSPKSKNLAKIL